PRRPAGGVRLLHRVGDLTRQLLDVLPGDRVAAAERVVAGPAVGEHRPGVRVGRRDHYVPAGNAGLRLDSLAALLDHAAGGADQVEGDEGDPGAVLLEDEGLGVERVVGALGPAGGVVPGHRAAPG